MMPKNVRWSHFKCLQGAHFEKMMGTAEEADAYCQKEDTRVGGPYIFGKLEKKQGKRNDLLALRDAIKSGKRGTELFDDDAVAGPAIKYQRGVQALTSAYGKPEVRGDIRVIFHFGPPGTGKTHCAHSDEGIHSTFVNELC